MSIPILKILSIKRYCILTNRTNVQFTLLHMSDIHRKLNWTVCFKMPGDLL